MQKRGKRALYLIPRCTFRAEPGRNTGRKESQEQAKSRPCGLKEGKSKSRNKVRQDRAEEAPPRRKAGWGHAEKETRPSGERKKAIVRKRWRRSEGGGRPRGKRKGPRGGRDGGVRRGERGHSERGAGAIGEWNGATRRKRWRRSERGTGALGEGNAPFAKPDEESAL